MITKEITICGKQVMLGYCFATEIAFKELSNEDITDYMMDAAISVQSQKMPDIKKTILCIIACMMAYYEDAEKTPVKDSDLMKEATPDEIGVALGTIINLRAQFYHIPKGEPEDKKSEGHRVRRKNA